MKRLLAIDIGNTTIHLGIFVGDRLTRRVAIPTRAGHYGAYLKKIFSQNKIDDAILCSVVPAAASRLVPIARGLLGKRPYNIGKNISVPVVNRYRRPAQVGADRLVNAYAATVFYGAPLVIVDFGTAITFDVVSRQRAYAGGMIVPGLQMSLDALRDYTALLPRVRLAPPKEFIGRDTSSSMLSGVVYGFAALTDTLVERIKNELPGSVSAVGTGGNAAFIAPYCRKLDYWDCDLTLKGLQRIYAGR